MRGSLLQRSNTLRQKRPKLPWLPAAKRCYGAGDEGMAPSLLPNNLMERPVKRNDLSQSLIAFDHSSTLVAVVELSFGSWLALVSFLI